MIKRIQFLFIFSLLFVSVVKAQVAGSSCNSPAVANLCSGNTFSASTLNFNNYISSWKVGSQTIKASGSDIIYQINLPSSSYQPVNLYATFAGYYPTCYAGNCSQTIYFLWFENSPCSSNPLAVDSISVSGSPTFQDSAFITYPVQSSKSQYYLVIAFNNFNYSSPYQYTLQLGFSNNEPLPQPTCTPQSAPYKGTLQLDQSRCYTSGNPYQLPLSSLQSNPTDTILYPLTLTSDSLPISDDNGNGFILSIKTLVFPVYSNGSYSTKDIYNWFDQFPYSYTPDSGSLYQVGLTVFFKNNGGASGLKGFRIQVPGAGSAYSNYPTGPGMYNTTGNWNVNYDGNTRTYTWLFNSPNGRGDNTDNNGYSCKVYTFSAGFINLGSTINAWYLSDNYGNDSMKCVYGPSNPPRTDCGMVHENEEWVSITGSGGSNVLKGQSCGSYSSVDIGVLLDVCYPSNYPTYTSDISVDNNGCINETDYSGEDENVDFTFRDFSVPFGTYDGYASGGICDGKPYRLILSGNGSFYTGTYSTVTPSTLVYMDSLTHVYHPVDSLGNIRFNQNYYNLSIPDSLPPYPINVKNDTFSIPLKTPGTYSILYSDYWHGQYSWDECSQEFLVISNRSNPKVLLQPTGDTDICKGQTLIINATGAQSYQWFPDSTIYEYYSGSGAEATPSVSTTYTIIGTDAYSCMDTETYSVKVHLCLPKANFDAHITCPGECTNYINDESTNSPTNWQWSFPGGTPSSFTGQNPPQVCYTDTALHPIKLLVSNSAGEDSIVQYVQSGTCAPLVLMTVNDSSICASTCVTFHNYFDLSYSYFYSYNWSFPGGSPPYYYSGFNAPPDSLNVCYANPGTYVAQLVSANGGTGYDTARVTIHVSGCKPTAGFSTPDTACLTKCIIVKNTSTGNLTSWLWSFVGGTPSAYTGVTPPVICYNTSGQYPVSLIVSDGTTSDTLVKIITVVDCSHTAGFKVSRDTICNSECITVTDTSSSTITFWKWGFTGASLNSFNGKTPPEICYIIPGNYAIQLIAGNSFSNDTIIKTIVVNNCLPVAAFISSDSICKTDCITVKDSSTNVTSWQWLFAGGRPSIFNGQTPPSVCYDTAGNYTIQLTASNNYGSVTITNSINVKDCSPHAGIKGLDTICRGDCITFLNESSANSTHWVWQFEGGLPSSYIGYAPPAVCYQNGGEFVVRLIASNNYGSDTAYKTITVFSPAAGNISAEYNAFCEGTEPTLYLNNSSGSIQWQSADTIFGFTNIIGANGTTCRIPLADHNVYVRVVSQIGNCFDTSAIFKVRVIKPISVSFTWRDTGLSAIFTPVVDPATGISYLWKFGDGDTSNLANPVHLFAKDTSYYVCLSVYETGYENCIYTSCQTINVGINAIANVSEQNKIQIYPDPFSDYLLIKSEGKAIKNIELFDVLGRQIINNEVGQGQPVDNVIRLDVSILIDGMYYIRVKTDGADYIQNVVKIGK